MMKQPKPNKKVAAVKAVAKPTAAPQSKTAPPATTAPAAGCSHDPETEEVVYAESGEEYIRKTPQGMLAAAEEAPDQRDLADYRDTISTLRKKGFSFREIAEFLTKRGVSANHNAVYRVYEKYMTVDEQAVEAELDREDLEHQAKNQ
jgi:hypothetical protein